jgi:hypothetical protein
VGTTTTLAGALTYGGVTLTNAVTGTGNMVLSASPTLTGTITAAAANFTGAVGVTGSLTLTNGASSTVFTIDQTTNGAPALAIFTGKTTGGTAQRWDIGENAFGDGSFDLYDRTNSRQIFSVSRSTGVMTYTNAINYGGVTLSNSVTGTGSMVLSASPTLTGNLTVAGNVARTSGNSGSIANNATFNITLPTSYGTYILTLNTNANATQPAVYIVASDGSISTATQVVNVGSFSTATGNASGNIITAKNTSGGTATVYWALLQTLVNA